METFKVSKKSWHYYMITQIGDYKPYNITNFCDYWRALVVTFIMLGFFSLFIIVGLTALVISLYISVYFTVEYPSIGIPIILSIIAFGFLFYYINKRTKTKKEPGIFKVKYLSWKAKFCPKLEITD
jgi:hypothetical protein